MSKPYALPSMSPSTNNDTSRIISPHFYNGYSFKTRGRFRLGIYFLHEFITRIFFLPSPPPSPTHKILRTVLKFTENSTCTIIRCGDSINAYICMLISSHQRTIWHEGTTWISVWSPRKPKENWLPVLTDSLLVQSSLSQWASENLIK